MSIAPSETGMTNESITNKAVEIRFLVFLRGIACLLVVWDHLVGIWTDKYAISFAPLTIVRVYITKPLGIIQDFGYLGVVLFFFVSGFIITHVAQRENRLVFLFKRLFRIYPPLIVSTLLIALCYRVYLYLGHSEDGISNYIIYDSSIAHMPVINVALAMTLLNYFRVNQNPVNGVAWTLVIEMIFYVLCFCILPLLRQSPRIAMLTLSLTCLLITFLARQFGPSFFLFAASVTYLPLLLIGQATYFVWSKQLAPYWLGVSAIGNYFLFIYGIQSIHPEFYPPENSYAISSIYGYLIFLLLLLLNARLTIPKVLGFYSKISYSLYLYHAVSGHLVLGILYPFIGYVPALLCALAAVTGLSYLSWRYVEIPSQQLARSVLRQFPNHTSLSRKLSRQSE
jgi:exopolysaccharide production protein ExoZ